MDTSNTHNNNTLWFFKHKGFDDKNIQEIFKKCKRLEGVQKENLSENWDYLKKIGIHERKLPSIVTKCPRIMTLDVNEKLIPMVQCLATLGTKPNEVASAITKFPHILTHSVEEKLCPLLAFFESLGVSGAQLGKMLLHNPRIISYSIDVKLSGVVVFLAGIGLTKEGTIGKILVKNPSIMGYNVEKRLRPTTEFLLSLGVTKLDLQKVAINFPEVLCRDVDKILKPNCDYLKTRGFDSQQIATLVARYPPILIKSVKNSLEPRIRFLVEVMNRGLEEAADYPEFFQHGLKKRLERREKLLKQKNVTCSLSEMLDCNHKKGKGRVQRGKGSGQRGRGRGQMQKDKEHMTKDEIRKNLKHEYMEEMLLHEEQKFEAYETQQDEFDQEALRYNLEEEARNLITVDANVQTQESVAANISDRGEIGFRLGDFKAEDNYKSNADLEIPNEEQIAAVAPSADKGKQLAEPSEQPELQLQAIKRGSKRKAPAFSEEALAKKRIIFHKNRVRSERVFNQKMKKSGFGPDGEGSTPDKAFSLMLLLKGYFICIINK
nr:transcription termination factor MTERF6, chloroplastic/mitochondrial [Tanacetum cinerariifolium]